MVLRGLVPAKPRVKRTHRGAKLQPHRFRHRQHRRGLCAQIERAVELKVGPDVGYRILLRHGFGIGGIDRLEPLDQREMRPRQRA